MNEERQDATSSSPQSQHSPAQPLGNKNGPAASMQTSSADAIGPFHLRWYGGSERGGTQQRWNGACIVSSVERGQPSAANTLASDRQDAGPEWDTHAHTAVGTNSGPDSLSTTDATPADGATEIPEPRTDPATVQRNDSVLDGFGTAPTHPSTAPAESKIPSEFNAPPSLDNELFGLEDIAGLVSMGVEGDSAVHGCVFRVLLLLMLLGVWDMTALC
ncbi:putative trans-sialidase [Trypanosoma cruzi]|nr:putative trans-sialidase [Trypanosoma cruzi]